MKWGRRLVWFFLVALGASSALMLMAGLEYGQWRYDVAGAGGIVLTGLWALIFERLARS